MSTTAVEARRRGAFETPVPASREALESQVLAMAEELAERSRRLSSALSEKGRLAHLLDTVLESIEAGVILVAPGGRILAANAAARRMQAVTGDGETRLCPALADGCDEGVVRIGGDAGPVWDLRRSRVSLGELGCGELLLVQDVTRLVRLEEGARRRSSLEALGRMAAEIAHEVRNPLGALELCATMLVEDLDENPDGRELAEQILLGVQQLAGTVTRLLATVRGSAGEAREDDVAAIVREVAGFLGPVARSRGIELETPPADLELVARVDSEGVRQALLNLIGNALEATPAGGRVRLRAERHGAWLGLEVADSGPGVPPERRETIFEAFYSTRPDGTGLGLSVVERVATGHGGRVEIDDSDLGGAAFRLLLPEGAARPEEE